jgi:NADH dehydrogenase FAD-containing subunit
MNELRKLKVDVRLHETVKGSAKLPDERQELTLSSGDKLVTDMYIPVFGLVPNSSYIPAKFLNASGAVMVDEYLQVKGTGDVWAIGDVSDCESPQYITCDKQSVHVAKNISHLLRNKTPLPYSPMSGRMINSLPL